MRAEGFMVSHNHPCDVQVFRLLPLLFAVAAAAVFACQLAWHDVCAASSISNE